MFELFMVYGFYHIVLLGLFGVEMFWALLRLAHVPRFVVVIMTVLLFMTTTNTCQVLNSVCGVHRGVLARASR